MRRRDFIAGLVVAGRIGSAHSQQTRRVGVLMGYSDADPEAKAMLAHLTKGLAELGWSEGRNLRLDIRWAPGNTDRQLGGRQSTEELEGVVRSGLELCERGIAAFQKMLEAVRVRH